MITKVIKRFPFFPLIAAMFVFTSIYGAVLCFSSVPIGDMWDGYIGFYFQILNHDYAAWWRQHNEHRILFSKILFWLDIKYFSGSAIFLIIINFLLMFSIWIGLLSYARLLLSHLWNKTFAYATASILCMVSFSWMQSENIMWAFQSCFFGGFLFPLLSFYFYAKYFSLKNFMNKNVASNLYLMLSIISGILSSWTLASGIIIMPLLVIMSIFLRQKIYNSLLLLLVSCITVGLYLYGYASPGYHSSPADSLLYHPIEILQYILIYLGSPFYHITSKIFLCFLSGTGFIVSFIYVLITYIKEKKQNPIYLASLLFVFYILVTALLTASGRINFGVDQALAIRYTTPVLMGWAVLFILLLSNFKFNRKYTFSVIAFISCLSLCIPQIEAYKNKNIYITRTNYINLAGLSLQLNIKDKDIVKNIYPDEKALYDNVEKTKDSKISIFNQKPQPTFYLYKNAALFDLKKCAGTISSKVELQDELNVYRVDGWAYNNKLNKRPKQVFFVKENDIIIGIANTGAKNRNAKIIIGKRALYSGFHGYVFDDPNKVTIYC